MTRAAVWLCTTSGEDWRMADDEWARPCAVEWLWTMWQLFDEDGAASSALVPWCCCSSFLWSVGTSSSHAIQLVSCGVRRRLRDQHRGRMCCNSIDWS